MSDVRDREPAIELKVQELELPRRQTLVARALRPMQRVTGRQIETRPILDPRQSDPLEVRPRNRAKAAIILSMIVVILLPIAAGCVYFFAFASDQYVAETRFAVRKAEAPRGSDGMEGSGANSPVTSNSLMSGGVNLGGENAEIIASYVHSRAVIDDVSRVVNVRAIFQRPDADFWARLPDNASPEELSRYWNKMVSVYIEGTSGIVQVTASAFRREDALDLVKAILAASENLANSLTLKMQADQTKLAEDEVRRAEGSVRFALADLTSFRNSEHLINPVDASQTTGKLLLQLMSDKIETEGRLFVTQRSQGPNAPGIAGTKARLESINQHISQLQDQLAGGKVASKNMASTLSRFEELELKKVFAEKVFEFAREGLERARLAAMGQSIYLAVFLPPSMPQDFSYPERFTDVMLIALAAVMTWVSGATITASILDHRL